MIMIITQILNLMIITKRNYEGLKTDEENGNVDVDDNDSSEESAGHGEDDFDDAVSVLNQVVARKFTTDKERKSSTESQPSQRIERSGIVNGITGEVETVEIDDEESEQENADEDDDIILRERVIKISIK